MAGTGFFDNWKPVDTSKEPTQKNEPYDLPSTSEIDTPVQVNSVSMDSPPMEALVDREPLEEYELVEPPAEAFTLPAEPSPTVSGEWSFPKSSNPAYKWVQMAQNETLNSKKVIMAGVTGGRKAGKSGMVTDSLTEGEVASGAQIWNVDLDQGGQTTKSAHHADKAENILIMNTWVRYKETRSRVPFDFPETYQKTMDILQYANEVAASQNAYFVEHGKMPKPYLKTLIFDGMDHWSNICETVMKIEDLELGVDGIAVAGKKATTSIGRFNWNIRKNRYKAALDSMKSLSQAGVHVYIITGMKASYDSNGNEIMGADVPAWLKDTEGQLEQLINVQIESEFSDLGSPTGKIKSVAKLVFDRSSLELPPPVILFEQDEFAGTGKWHGWKGLKDGSFYHAEDVHFQKEE